MTDLLVHDCSVDSIDMAYELRRIENLIERHFEKRDLLLIVLERMVERMRTS
ncbi:hypothetical protein LCGC14_0311000 [marine sediment metagenome]|uniref:Uncharacterized protein n=1 Tax=marine sediment metagenome TaxID=412755 RepID=A0A0F9U4U9_9ZZZZ